jgi:hypothetical protein
LLNSYKRSDNGRLSGTSVDGCLDGDAYGAQRPYVDPHARTSGADSDGLMNMSPVSKGGQQPLARDIGCYKERTSREHTTGHSVPAEYFTDVAALSCAAVTRRFIRAVLDDHLSAPGIAGAVVLAAAAISAVRLDGRLAGVTATSG